jgi:hypothetical protein
MGAWYVLVVVAGVAVLVAAWLWVTVVEVAAEPCTVRATPPPMSAMAIAEPAIIFLVCEGDWVFMNPAYDIRLNLGLD